MKLKHMLFLGVTVVGVLFLLHMWQSHGGIGGIKQGLGFSGGSYGGGQ